MINRSLKIFDRVRQDYPGIQCFDFTRSAEWLYNHREELMPESLSSILPFPRVAIGNRPEEGSEYAAESACVIDNSTLLNAVHVYLTHNGQLYHDEIFDFTKDQGGRFSFLKAFEHLEKDRNQAKTRREEFARRPPTADADRVGLQRDRGVLLQFALDIRQSITRQTCLFTLYYAALGFHALATVKNIEAHEVVPCSVSRAERRRGDLSIQYHVLKIHLPGKKTESESYGPYEKDARLMPLHLVRGHFANYEEKPLFGKYFGKFFIPPHARGSKENGIVEKDYEITS